MKCARVYTRHIGDMGICLKYAMYMNGIYYAYAEKVQVEIYHIYTMIIHDYLWYKLYGIYFVYT
jgi:hypothetical protein